MPKDGIKPAWFLPRGRDHPPTSALRLGDVIASPFHPEEAINGDPPPPVPAELLRTIDQENWSWAKEFDKSQSGGVFASFLDVVGVGPEVELRQAKAKSDIYNAERLVTQYFNPNRKYIEEVLNDPDVKDELTGPNRRSKLYLISGLKIAYGATRAIEMMNKRGIHFQVAINPAAIAGAPGVPTSIGPKTDVSSSTKEKLSGGKLDFVFGIQVRELRYKKGRVEHEKYDKGALYGQQPAKESDDDDTEDDAIDLADVEVGELSTTEPEGSSKHNVGSGEGEDDVQVIFLQNSS